MLQQIRDRAQGWGAKIIVALIALTFTFFGAESLVSYFGSGASGNNAATVNGESISRQTLQTEVSRAIRSGRVPPDQQEQAQQAILDSLITREVVDQYAREGGMAFTDRQLDQMLVNRQEFQDSQGRFSAEIFRNRLNSAGFTPDAFRQQLQEDMLAQQLQNGLIAATFVLPSEAKQLAALRFQQRSFRYTRLTDADLQQPIELDEQQLRDWYQSHQQQFQRPEQVQLAWIELNRNQLPQSDQSIDEAQLQQLYDQRRANAPRQVSDIIVRYGDQRSREEAQARVEEIRSRLANGADFAELAREYSDDPSTASRGGSLGTVNEGIFGNAFDQAVNSTAPGDVATVEDDGYFHVLRVDGIDIPPFDQMRDELAAEVRQQRSGERFQQLAQQLSDQSFSADDLQSVADNLGLELHRSGWVDRNADDTDQKILTEPGVMEAAFSNEVLNDGYNSEPIELGDDRRVVLRVLDHREATTLAFDEVRDQVRQAALESRRQQLLAQRADDIVSQLRQGDTPAGVEWSEAQNITRDGGGDLPAALVSAAFTIAHPQGEGTSFGHQVVNGDQVVFAIDSVSADPSDQQLANLTEQLWNLRSRENVSDVTGALRNEADISRQ
ncbi:SurA N-terminal domain-containing protein [Kushneria aurantia]|uniref:Periplasmic chaperone PpiD n=1 Tax=Kushneria aurantia TaxID=504092 RepID=A0ABV6G4C2_9GAMM|nr:SurA N-terminal domain-containing protein [Kushneria aurantia]